MLPHLLVPGSGAVLAEASASRILVLNLDGRNSSATGGRAVPGLHEFALSHCLAGAVPGSGAEYVLADPRCVDDIDELEAACKLVDAELVLERVSVSQRETKATTPRHDTHLFGSGPGTCFLIGKYLGMAMTSAVGTSPAD